MKYGEIFVKNYCHESSIYPFPTTIPHPVLDPAALRFFFSMIILQPSGKRLEKNRESVIYKSYSNFLDRFKPLELSDGKEAYRGYPIN